MHMFQQKLPQKGRTSCKLSFVQQYTVLLLAAGIGSINPTTQ